MDFKKSGGNFPRYFVWIIKGPQKHGRMTGVEYRMEQLENIDYFAAAFQGPFWRKANIFSGSARKKFFLA